MPADPAEIEARIAATRAELAATLDQLAERVSPKNVLARQQTALKARVNGVGGYGRTGPDGEPVGGPPWPAIAAGAAALLALLALVRRRRRRG